MSNNIRWITIAVGLLMVATMPAVALPRATDRGEMKVSEARDQIVVAAYEWVARHDKSAGGCLGSVYLKEVDRELLGGLAGARVNQWFEKFDRSVSTEIATPDARTVVITVKGYLCYVEGTASPIALTHLYKYRREYLRHEVTLSVEEPVAGVTEVIPFEMVGAGFTRFAARDSFEHDLHSWRRGGTAHYGTVSTIDGVVWEETMPARYLGLFTGAFGGIDWFPASDGECWRWIQGPEKGSWRVEVFRGKPQLSAAVYRQEEPITLEGSTTWSFYTSWPCATKNFQPDPEHVWVLPQKAPLTVADVERFHEWGLEMVMPAHSWEFRPYVLTPPEEYTFLQPDNSVPLADAVAKAHELGMTVVPYFCVPDVCVTDEEYARIGEEIRWTWSGNPENERWHTGSNPGFHAGSGCYCSENWKRVVHPYLEQAWQSQDFDGIYYDAAQLLHCTNPHHCGGVHMISDGLFELCDWTRELMGPGKILFLHTASERQPCYAIENYADHIIFYESRATTARIPRWGTPDEFYQYFTVANNTGFNLSTSVFGKWDVSAGEAWTRFALWGDHSVGYCDPKSFGQDEKTVKQWEMSQRTRLRFEPYDLTTYEFVPLVQHPAEVSYGGGGWASAWKKDGEVLLLVANLHKEPKRFRVTPQPIIMDAVAGGPLEITIEGQPPQRVAEDDYMRVLRRVEVPAEDFVLIRIARTK